MAASHRQLKRNIFILEVLKLHIFYVSYCDVMLKRNNFYGFLLGKAFRKKFKHTELALNFFQKQ